MNQNLVLKKQSIKQLEQQENRQEIKSLKNVKQKPVSKTISKNVPEIDIPPDKTQKVLNELRKVLLNGKPQNI